MRPIVLAVLGGLFLAVGWRHLTGLGKAPIVLTVLGLALGVLGVQEVLWLKRQGDYSQVASDYAGGREVKVHCQRSISNAIDVSSYMGYVPYPSWNQPATDAYLRLETCNDLASWLQNKDDPSPEDVRGLHVLTHEAMHLMGERNEAHAECQAIQRDAQTAMALGASASQAMTAARLYYEFWYPRVPDSYRDPECKPGGELDEGLSSAPWGGGSESPIPDQDASTGTQLSVSATGRP